MSFLGGPRVPATPTLPQGETVASYGTYLEAQKAVDHLSDHQFPVQVVTIVGTDLRMVERVTGRLTYARVAMGGFGSGAWFGVFIGMLFLLSGAGSGILFASVLVLGAVGLLFAVIAYAVTGGKRDFTSQSQIVAGQYAVLCAADKANDARALLREVGGVRAGGVAAPPAAPVPAARPSDPSATYPAAQPGTAPQPGTPGAPGQPPQQPRYGQLAPQPGQPVAGGPAGPAGPATPGAPTPPAPPAEPRYGQLRPSGDPQQPDER